MSRAFGCYKHQDRLLRDTHGGLAAARVMLRRVQPGTVGDEIVVMLHRGGMSTTAVKRPSLRLPNAYHVYA